VKPKGKGLIARYVKFGTMHRRVWMVYSELNDKHRHQGSQLIVPNLLSLFNTVVYNKEYRSVGSAANFVWKPKKAPYPMKLYTGPLTEVYSLKLGHDKSALSTPLGFFLVWKTHDWDDRDWKGQHLSIWGLKCNPGYVALGHLAWPYDGKNPWPYPNGENELMWCVKRAYTKLD